MRFVFLFFLLLMPSIALSSGAIVDEEFEVHNEFDVTDYMDDILSGDMDLLQDPGYPGGGGGGGGQGDFQCQIIVIVIDRDNRDRERRHSFWGNGRSWFDSRVNAFQRYGNWIGRGGYWQSRFNHRFHFDNCRS